MNAPARTGRPRFTGVHTHRDPQGRFEFRHPWGWEASDLDEDRDGIIVRPEVDDEATYFAIWLTALDVSVTADDLPDLKAGFDDGLAQLPDVKIESASDNTYNNIIKLERTLTYTEDGQTRKRRIWCLYADYWQYVIAFQGSTVEEYHYWLPMGNYCFTSFNLPQALWFATDPKVYKRPGREDPESEVESGSSSDTESSN